ncbi:hypothetical protein HPB47_000190, partial [Ixodes persulcatus]
GKPSVSIYGKQYGDSTQSFGTSDSRSTAVSPTKAHFPSPGKIPPLFFRPYTGSSAATDIYTHRLRRAQQQARPAQETTR